MKRIGALLLFGFAVMWGAALFDVRGASPTPSVRKAVSAEQPALRADEPAEAPVAKAATVEKTADRLPADSAVAQPEPAKPGATGAITRAAQRGFALIGKAAGKLLPEPQPVVQRKAAARKSAAEATGELGEGLLSPEFVEYEQRYAREARDGDWAPSQEERVHALLKTQAWADDVGLVHCQQTLCRIVVESEVDATDTFQQLIGVPGLREVTGLGPDTPYSLRSGQLSVYFRGREATTTL